MNTQLEPVSHLPFLTSLQCCPPSRRVKADTGTHTHTHILHLLHVPTVRVSLMCYRCSSAERLLTPTVYCDMSSKSPPPRMQRGSSDKALSHRNLRFRSATSGLCWLHCETCRGTVGNWSTHNEGAAMSEPAK